MTKIPCYISILVLSSLMLLGTDFAFAKPNLKKMTSSQSSQQIIEETSLASDLNTHSVGVGLGQTTLLGNFEESGDDGITADFFYNYTASHTIDLLLNFHYSKHKFKSRWVRLLGATLSLKAKIFHFDAFTPYVLGGFGFYSPKVKRQVGSTLLESKSKTVFGDNLGVGAEVRLNRRFLVGILFQYHNPFDLKQEFGSDIEGSYAKLLITTFYTF